MEHNADLNVFSDRYRSPLCWAVCSQNSEVVQMILDKEPALIDKVDETGKTPLHIAANYSSPEVVRCLLKNGANVQR